jgi:hypothetical protein
VSSSNFFFMVSTVCFFYSAADVTTRNCPCPYLPNRTIPSNSRLPSPSCVPGSLRQGALRPGAMATRRVDPATRRDDLATRLASILATRCTSIPACRPSNARPPGRRSRRALVVVGSDPCGSAHSTARQDGRPRKR